MSASESIEGDVMQLAMVGLGRMGANMVRRLMKSGHQCVVFDHSQEAVSALAKEGAVPSTSLEDMVKKLQTPLQRRMDIFTVVPLVRGTLTKWCITASSTESWLPTQKA